ncbi:MAG: DUF4037 domain-containing protein [Oscillospiraceae bacterium]|nr:DUF4037 domain-containing protein [Oscillospiraceae bacterium]
MKEFINGLDLCESFFSEYMLPFIQQHYPDLKFSAGLITAGSQILGYDDIVSTDHGWSASPILFLNDNELNIRDELAAMFEKNLPSEYKGYRSSVWITSINEVIEMYIGKMPQTDIEWLAVSEHRLLGLTAGKIFLDMLDIEETRKKLSFYPHDVKMYLIASQWSIIAEEQAFMKRTSDVGDEIGSRIICARIAERLMRLCFLYKNKYAPYSKWFGTAFNRLSLDNIHNEITAALFANTITERERCIVNAQVLVAELHNACNITEPFEIKVQDYYDRDIKVIFTDNFAGIVKEKITNPELKNCPLIGSMSQIGNLNHLWDNPQRRGKIQQLYD